MMSSRCSAKIIVATIGILVILASCSLFENDDNNNEPEQTYPEAFDFELSTVRQLKTKVVPPDSLNADVYVTAAIKCPEGAQCFLPDGIIISDSLDAESMESQMHLYVEKPLEFTEDQGYRMSLEITTWPGNGEKRLILMGYSHLEDTNSK